jgi:hypothetical protein
VGPRAGLDAVVREKIPSPYRDSNPRSSSQYPSAIPLSYPGSKLTHHRTITYRSIYALKYRHSVEVSIINIEAVFVLAYL